MLGADDAEVIASNRRPSSCVDVTGAVDVDVEIRMAGITMMGEVTLAPREYDGRLDAYGSTADHWISGKLLAELRELALSDTGFRALCAKIVAEAS